MSRISVSVWLFLIVLRVCMVLLPQNGYIHPDEFFQSAEPVAGDILRVKSDRPWEFNTRFPLRSIIFPYLTCGLPLFITHKLGSLVPSSSYMVLIAPRIFMTLTGLINDYSAFRIARDLNIDAYLSVLLYSTSYVTFLYLTRAFSNTTETTLFSVVLLITVSGIARKLRDRLNHGDTDRLKHSHRKNKSVGNRTDESRKRREESLIHSVWRCYALGVLITCGTFNRPTFPCFVFVPVVFWLLYDRKVYDILTSAVRMLTTVILTSIAIICIDSSYYREDFTDGFSHFVACIRGDNHVFYCLNRSIDTYAVITPMNFVQYNLQAKNLADHGLHPRYLHFLVNLQLLYGYLPLCTAYVIVKLAYHRYLRNTSGCDHVEDTPHSLIASVVFLPVLLLSIFPHQEPRFLLPQIVPICVMAAEVLTSCQFKYLLIKIWLAFNVLLFLFYGILHQGGVVPSLLKFNAIISQGTGDVDIVFWKTYMPPTHLLLVDKHDHSVNTTDLKGVGFTVLQESIDTICGNNRRGLYLALPYTVSENVFTYNNCTVIAEMFPHLSLEDPPDISGLAKQFEFVSIRTVLGRLKRQLSLIIVRIDC